MGILDNTSWQWNLDNIYQTWQGKFSLSIIKRTARYQLLQKLNKMENFNKLLNRLPPLPEIWNSLLVNYPGTILHIINELGFHFGMRTTIFYT